MKLAIFFSQLLFLLSASAHAATQNVHPCAAGKNPICGYIVSHNKDLNLDDALKLSNLFLKTAKDHHLPVELLLAIAKQESNFRTDAVRMVRGFSLTPNGIYAEASVGTDFCMMQINVINIKSLNLDAFKLKSNSEYCLTSGASILQNFMLKHKHKEKIWWSRYNASSSAQRKNYQVAVERWIKQINALWVKLDPQGTKSTLEMVKTV